MITIYGYILLSIQVNNLIRLVLGLWNSSGMKAMPDELRSEYDLENLEVRKVGPGRKSFGRFVVQLEPDVAEVFPNTQSVNEALRFLIRVTRENKPVLSGNDGDV